MERLKVWFLIPLIAFLFAACDFQPKAQYKFTPPQPEYTSYTEALYQLGKMTIIYNTPDLNIQSENIIDDTGASSPLATGGEIQRDITQILKTTLNSIGGKVHFVDYDPAYIHNMMAIGYSTFKKKVIPDVVVTGGITGFDRALIVGEKSKDFNVDGEFPNIQNEHGTWPPSRLVGLSIGDSLKYSISKITLDFTLKNFQTQVGIPYMSVTNSMVVHKTLGERELSITILGPTFGVKGSTKRVQGRHEAVRLLVQLSMIQLVGRYLALPYWRLLGPEAKPDKIVIMMVERSYNSMNKLERLVNVQQWLYLHGYNVDITGEMDNKTIAALKQFDPSFDTKHPKITMEIFKKLYLTIPLTDDTYIRRLILNKALSS